MHPIDHDGADVAAGDLVRQFSHFRDQATKKPVFVTTYGRRTHVLLSVDDFDALGKVPSAANDEPSLPDDRLVMMLAEWIDDGLIICNRSLAIASINRVAQALTGKSAAEVTGKPLFAALPEVTGTLIEGYVQRTMLSHSANSAEVPSPFHADRWLRFQSFPLGGCTVIKLRDITEEMQAHRLANVKEAVVEAIELHGTISYVRLSQRATIDRTQGPFETAIGLGPDRLRGHALADLVDLPLRPQFREALETVIRDLEPRQLRTRFLANNGGTISMRVTIVPLVGNYGCEGAVTFMTSDDLEPAATST